MERDGKIFPRWGEDPGWRGWVGFISTPIVTPTHMEFLRIAPEGLAVFQTMTHVPNFKTRTEDIRQAVAQLEDCAIALKDAGVDLVTQSGTPFSFVNEGGLQFVRDLQARIEKSTGLPMVMQGLAILNALKKKGYSSAAVACTYYNNDLATRYTRFLEDAGLQVLAMENWVSQGLYETQRVVDLGRGKHPLSNVYKAARIVATHAPQADCIILSGGGIRTLDLLEPLEHDLGKPVISSHAAQFWEILVRLGIWEPIKGWGSLLASLEKGPDLQ